MSDICATCKTKPANVGILCSQCVARLNRAMRARKCDRCERLERELATVREKLINEIGLRVLTEIFLEEAGGKAFTGTKPSDDDLPSLIRFSMQQTLDSQKALGEALTKLARYEEVKGNG